MTRQVHVDCRQPISFQSCTWEEIAIFALKQTMDFYHKQDTPVYMCFIDAINAFVGVNHCTLAKKLLDRNMPLHILILFILWYKEQEFMV